MHELSIARSLLSVVEEVVPPGAQAENIRVRAGPLRAIEPDALELAWRACTLGNALEGSRLELMVSPWSLYCPSCHASFEADSWDAVCSCGEPGQLSRGGDELLVESIEILETPTQEVDHGDSRRDQRAQAQRRAGGPQP
ncbi:MAG: hydrogenase maturation nickel metallochaperone HypA [Gemmatimonadetes bacterium]|nr:hydrogenase maturation nickel metallochaperone HypA [Gemmatimonadota bacterium]